MGAFSIWHLIILAVIVILFVLIVRIVKKL